MNNPFVRELILINRVMLIAVTGIILGGTVYYGGSLRDSGSILAILGVMALAFATKRWRIKRKGRELDERVQTIMYRAIAVGFYGMLAVVFWYWTKDMVQNGEISTRTLVELMVAGVSYVGAYYYLKLKT